MKETLTVAKLAALVPGNTEIHFQDLGTDRGLFCPASEEELLYDLGQKKVYLRPVQEG